MRLLRTSGLVLQDGHMACRYRTRDGWWVEIVQLTCTPDHHDGQWLRIRYCGYYVHDARDITELKRYVRLAELEEAFVIGLRRRRAAWWPACPRWSHEDSLLPGER
jgi:hypothetical protein